MPFDYDTSLGFRGKLRVRHDPIQMAIDLDGDALNSIVVVEEDECAPDSPGRIVLLTRNPTLRNITP